MSHEYPLRSGSKDDTQELNRIIASLESSIQGRFDDLKGEILNLKDIVIKNFLEENKNLNAKIKQLEAQVIQNEKSLNSLDQYGRRNNLEITGIPISEDDNKELENNVVKILGTVGVKISKVDLEAVHRLGKPRDGSHRTIVRFVNRKHCKDALTNRKKLRSIDSSSIGLNKAELYFNENLTPMNGKIAYKSRVLKRAGIISNTFTKDGVTNIVKKVGDKSIKVLHESALDEMFPHFQFDKVNE